MKNNQSSQKRRVHHVQDDEFDNINNIDDLILEILLHLPPITVLRFKVICKKWYSLISNPNFLRRHSSFQLEKRTGLLLHGYNYPICPSYKHFEFVFLPQDNLEPPLLKILPHPSLSLFPGNLSQNWNLEDSCNGLLLLSFSMAYNLSAVNRTYYIFNPTTKHNFKLPMADPIPNIKEEEFEATSHIVFDPSVSLSYKVIRWLKLEKESPANTHCQLYSSETGLWRILSTNSPNDVDLFFDSRSTLLNGVLYWPYGATSLDVSYCLDVEKESVSFLQLPPKPIGCQFRQCLYFGECGGRLQLIEKYWESPYFVDPPTLPFSFDIIELQQQCQEGYSPWFVKYRVNIEMGFNPLVGDKYPPEIEFNHCYMTKNKGGEEEEVLSLSINQTSIVSYNLRSNTFGKELTVPNSKPSISLDFRSFFPFTPTLFPVP